MDCLKGKLSKWVFLCLSLASNIKIRLFSILENIKTSACDLQGDLPSQFKTQNPDPKKWHEVTSNETGSVQSPKTDKQSHVRSLDNLWIPSLSEHWRCETRWESTGSTFWKRRWNTEKIMQTSSIMCCTLWLFNVAMKNKHLNLGTVVLCKSECLLSISMSHGFHSCHSYVEYPDGTVYPDS